MQFSALILDTFRSLKARALYWVVLVITLIIVVVFASMGCTEKGWYMGFGLLDAESSYLVSGSSWERSMLLLTSRGIVDYWILSFGILFVLFPTSTIFPDSLQPGAVDLILSKPITRFQFLLGKYLGALLFMALQAAILALGLVLVLAFRLQEFHWKIFLSIPIAVLIFSYVFCFNILIGILTKSPIAAILLTVVFWMILWVVQVTGSVIASSKIAQLQEEGDLANMSKSLGGAYENVEKIMRFLPKTMGTARLFERSLRDDAAHTWQDMWLRGMFGTEEAYLGARAPVALMQEAGKKLEESPGWIIGSSLAFEALMLALAYWRLRCSDF